MRGIVRLLSLFSFFYRGRLPSSKMDQFASSFSLLLPLRPSGYACLHACRVHLETRDKIWHPPSPRLAFSFRAGDYDPWCPSSSKAEVEIRTCAGLKLKLAITFNGPRGSEGRDAKHGGGKRFSFMGERVPLLSVLLPPPLSCEYNGQRKTNMSHRVTVSLQSCSVLDGTSGRPDDASLTEGGPDAQIHLSWDLWYNNKRPSCKRN